MENKYEPKKLFLFGSSAIRFFICFSLTCINEGPRTFYTVFEAYELFLHRTLLLTILMLYLYDNKERDGFEKRFSSLSNTFIYIFYYHTFLHVITFSLGMVHYSKGSENKYGLQTLYYLL